MDRRRLSTKKMKVQVEQVSSSECQDNEESNGSAVMQENVSEEVAASTAPEGASGSHGVLVSVAQSGTQTSFEELELTSAIFPRGVDAGSQCGLYLYRRPPAHLAKLYKAPPREPKNQTRAIQAGKFLSDREKHDPFGRIRHVQTQTLAVKKGPHVFSNGTMKRGKAYPQMFDPLHKKKILDESIEAIEKTLREMRLKVYSDCDECDYSYEDGDISTSSSDSDTSDSDAIVLDFWYKNRCPLCKLRAQYRVHLMILESRIPNLVESLECSE